MRPAAPARSEAVAAATWTALPTAPGIAKLKAVPTVEAGRAEQ